MTNGINRHKARQLSGLRSSDLSSDHPQKAPLRVAFRPSEMAQKAYEKLPITAIECHYCGSRT